MPPSRRAVLGALLAAPALPLWGLPSRAAVPAQLLDRTPACDDGDEQTVEQTEGPYFKPSSPLKQDFRADAPGGEPITIAGYVLDETCKPVPQALVELWHADEKGRYDNEGFRLRGHAFTDAEGRWWFQTIVPAIYPGRTRHFHLKVQKPGGGVLTTQLYFPGEPLNESDGIFDERLLMTMADTDLGRFGRYDFVV